MQEKKVSYIKQSKITDQIKGYVNRRIKYFNSSNIHKKEIEIFFTENIFKITKS